jgi:hypothetical protein
VKHLGDKQEIKRHIGRRNDQGKCKEEVKNENRKKEGVIEDWMVRK